MECILAYSKNKEKEHIDIKSLKHYCSEFPSTAWTNLYAFAVYFTIPSATLSKYELQRREPYNMPPNYLNKSLNRCSGLARKACLFIGQYANLTSIKNNAKIIKCGFF